MSLTSFLRNKDVQERFRQEFRKPKFTAKKDLLAPPLTKHYSLVGTAFDYLLRFYVERLNPNAITKKWVAEFAISHPLSPLLTGVVINADTGLISICLYDGEEPVKITLYRDFSYIKDTSEIGFLCFVINRFGASTI